MKWIKRRKYKKKNCSKCYYNKCNKEILLDCMDWADEWR